ncbi:unnamed protein product [Symbiodinium necroappetens]|uniref:Calmodulin n=1 Tax=Symbiodinium necroappetens TaxID=1628268 RepID=A0A812MMU5_9DINO|nr:unnamed protein product [Symbiodinium necroappetens]
MTIQLTNLTPAKYFVSVYRAWSVDIALGRPAIQSPTLRASAFVYRCFRAEAEESCAPILGVEPVEATGLRAAAWTSAPRVDFDDGETVWIRDISREASGVLGREGRGFLESSQATAERSGVPVQGLTLTFLGLSLKDHWRLADCGIKDCDAVKADMQVKRGGHFVGAQLAAAVQAPLKYPSQCFCTKDYEGTEAGEEAAPQLAEALAFRETVTSLEASGPSQERSTWEGLHPEGSELQSLAASPVQPPSASGSKVATRESTSQAEKDDTLSFLTELHRDMYRKPEASEGRPGESEGFRLLQSLRRESRSHSECEPKPASTLQAFPDSPPPMPRRSPVSKLDDDLVVLQEQRHDQILTSMHLQEQNLQCLRDQQQGLLQELQTAQEAQQQASTKQHSELRDMRDDLRLLLSGQQEVHQDLTRLQQRVEQGSRATPTHPQRPEVVAEVVSSRPSNSPRQGESLQLSARRSSDIPNSRRWLIQQVFRMLDVDGDQRLTKVELKGLADLMGFEGAEADWLQEYRLLCADSHVDEGLGFDLEGFVALLENPKGCPSTTDSLFRALLDLRCTGDEDRERASLVIRLFEALDRDGDGFLGVRELWPLASATGFKGSDDDWAREYRLLCEDLANTKELLRKGLDLPTFGRLLADTSGSGLLCSVPQLHAFLADFTRTRESGREIVPRSHAGSHGLALASDELPLKVPNVPSGAKAKPRKEVQAVEDHSENRKSNGTSGLPAKSRSRLIRTVFQLMDANSDGVLDSEELFVFASLSGFKAGKAAWELKYRRLCERRSLVPEAGISAQTFGALLEDSSDAGLYCADAELHNIIHTQRRPASNEAESRRPSTSSEQVPALERPRLINALFWYLDVDKDGLLGEHELFGLVSQLGIDTDTVEWPRAFQEICGKYGVNAIDLEHFQLLLDDRSEVTYCEPESLHSILARIWQPGDDSPSAPPQMNSTTCGSTGELAVAIAVRRPAMALSDGSSSKLRQYVSKLPHDSYSICNYHSSDKPDKLFEVQEQHGGKCRVWLNPLLGFPEAIKEAPRAEFEELSADVDDAKERIAEKVLKKLKQTVDPPDVIRKGSKDNQKLNLAPVSLFVVEVEDEEGTWHLLTTSPAEHNYQLCISNVKLRLEVSSDSKKIDWKPEELDNVLKFHHQALCREGDQHQLDELL